MTVTLEKKKCNHKENETTMNKNTTGYKNHEEIAN